MRRAQTSLTRVMLLGRVQKLIAIGLVMLWTALACGPRDSASEPVGTSSSAVGTCGSDSVTATYPLSQTRNYTQAWQVVVPSTVAVAGGSWTGIADATLSFTTSAGTVRCGYQQTGTNTTSQPFHFLDCQVSWNNWQNDGGPGEVLAVTAVQVSANCYTGTCSVIYGANPSVTGTWAYVDPGWSNPCETETCSGGPNGPQQTGTPVANGTACAPDACHSSATCQSGVCTNAGTLPTDDGNPCTDDSTCDPVKGVTHTFNTSSCPIPAGAGTGYDLTVASNFANSTSFLYSGANAIQQNFSATIDPKRASVVRGRVIDRDTSGRVQDIKVSVLGHDEYGWTFTRSDGYFDLAVNGGDTYTLQFTCDPNAPNHNCATLNQTTTPKYVTTHRQAKTRWLDYTILDDVAVFAKDTASTITPDSSQWQSARASGPVTDSDGSRTATLLVPPSTHATNLTASQYTVRLTEATAGAQNGTTNGPAAMPADLPPQSGYTYAVELSMDEAEAQGLTSVAFNNTMLFYVDNFIGAPLDGDGGATVPAGYYDREAGAWRQDQLTDGGLAQNGRSLKIIGVVTDAESNPAVQLSLDGVNEISNYADPSIVPAIADGEREQLATIYCPNQQCPQGGKALWRIPVNHFTPWDYNYAEIFPSDAISPIAEKPYSNGSPQDPRVSCGSIIECEGRVLGEEIPIAGTPFSLHYRSEQQAGYWPTLTIPLSDSPVALPSDLDRIELDLQIAGVATKFTYKQPPQHLTVHYTWTKTDAYNREVQGTVNAHVTVSYVYNLEHNGASVETTTVFGSFGNGTQIAHRAHEARVSATYDVPIGSFDAQQLGLGGWTLSAQHVYEPQSNMIWRGDGGKQIPAARPDVVEQLYQTSVSLKGLAAGPDGSIFVGQHPGDGSDNVAKLSGTALKPPPTLVPITSSALGSPMYFNDGQDAGGVHIQPHTMAIAGDGSLIVAEEQCNRIVRISDPSGSDPKLYLIAGMKSSCLGATYTSDGNLAVNSPLCQVSGVGALADGSIVWMDNCRATGTGDHGVLIRRVRPDGTIETVAGKASGGYIDSGCASAPCNAKQESISTAGQFAVGPDGSLYFSDWSQGTGLPACDIWRVTTDGMLRRYGGTGTCGAAKNDGGDALSAQFSFSSSLRMDGSSLLISDVANYAIRRISGDGIVETLAGNGGQLTSIVNDSPAKSSTVQPPADAADPTRSPDGWVYLISANPSTATVVRFGSPQTGAFLGGDALVMSSDGSQLFEFDPNGRHNYTRTPERGKTLYAFTYDTGNTNKLLQITDVAGNLVNINYVNSTTVTISSTHDAAKLTTLTLDASGYLHSVTNANNETWGTIHDSTGRLTSFTPPNGMAHTFSYTWDGLLAKDTSPISGTQGTTLIGSDIQKTHTVDVITPEGHDTQHVVSNAMNTVDAGPNLVETRTHTDPAGLVTTDKRYDDSSSVVTTPDGTTLTTTYTADPRFGFSTPRVASTTLVTGTGPNQKTIASSAAYSATLSNSVDPTSLTDELQSFTLAGNTFKLELKAQSSPATVTLTSPAGRTVVMQLDNATDRVTKISVPGLDDVNVTYDSERIGNVTQGSDSVTNQYDLTGFLDQIQSSSRGTTTFASPDGVNRPRSVTLPGTSTMTVAYDADGNVQSVVTPGGNSHALSYNAVDLLGVYTPPGGTGSTTYSYNLDGDFLAASYPGGTARYRSYDQAGRLATESYANPVDGTTIQASWTYFPGGDSKAGHVATLNTGDVNLTYTYDGEMQMSENVRVNAYPNFNRTINKTYASYPPLALATRNLDGDLNSQFTLCYDNDGLVVGVAVGASETCSGAHSYTLSRSPTNGMITSATAGVLSETYSYDASGALLDYSVNGGSIYHVNYKRDLPGGDERVHTETENISNGAVENCSITYTYDSANRLSAVASTGTGCPASATYTYDGNIFPAKDGNLDGWTYDGQDRLTTNWSYTANGDALQQTSGLYKYFYYYDVLGNLRRWYYTYNGSTYRTQDYKIDGRNRRIARFANGSLDHGWLYDGDRIIGEVDANGNALSHFIYVTKPNVPDLMLKKVNGTWTLYRIISDQIGSVKAVVQTTSPGTVAATVTYSDVWGTNGGGGFLPFGFAGGEWEYWLGNFRFGARDYNPTQRRWLSKDLLRLDAGYNLYTYCDDDPVNCIDPTGLLRAPVSHGFGSAKWLHDLAEASYAKSASYVEKTKNSLRCKHYGSALGNAIGAYAFGVWGAAAELTPVAADAVGMIIGQEEGPGVIVPEGGEGPFPTRSPGFMYTGGSGGNGLSEDAAGVRIMDPDENYPNGRATYFNESGQTVDPYTGRTLSKKDSWWHKSLK